MLLGLGACSTTITQARDPLKQAPGAEEALVVVSLTTNTPQVGALDGIRVQKLQPAGSDKREYFQLSPIATGMARDTSLFAAVLPAGEYEFDRLDHFASQRYLPLGAGQRARIGAFVVQGGQAVDLGRLIVTPVNTSVVVGRSELAGTNQGLLRRFAPDYAALFKGEPATGWRGPRGEKDFVEAYAQLRPTGALGLVEAADGRVYAASRLGTVLVRSPEGRWSAVRSGRLESLLHAQPVNLPDASLVAVGELGTLLKLPVGGQRLEPVNPGNLPPGSAFFFTGRPDRGWFIAMQHGHAVKLLHSNTLEGGDWRVMRTESVEPSAWSGANPIWFWPTANGLAYATAAGKLHFYDMASGQWQERDAPAKSRLVGLTPMPAALGALTSPGGGFAGVFATQYLSLDEGRSWKEIPSGEVKVKIMPPLPLPDGSLLMAGGVFSDPSIYLSRDEGKRWQKQATTTLDQTFVALPSGLLLAVDQGRLGLFGIRSSKDQGATWSTEYSNFDRQAYDAQESAKKK